jgi:hypothetical protein
MENPGSVSRELNNFVVVDKLPSAAYAPTVNLAMMRIVVKGQVVDMKIIQRHDSAVAGQNPVWKALPLVTAEQMAPLIVLPNMMRPSKS